MINYKKYFIFKSTYIYLIMDEDVLLSEFKDSNKNMKKVLKLFIPITVILFLISVTFIVLFIVEVKKDDDDDNNEKEDNSPSEKYIPLSLWNEGIPKKKIIDFVNSAANEKSIDFIEKEDRIAVFDFDGTIFQETAPTYLDFQ